MADTSRSDDFDHMINVGHTERLLSLVGGGVLAALAMRRPTAAGAGMALLGGALVARGLTGYCPVYGLLGGRHGGDRAAIPAQDVDEGTHAYSRNPGDIYRHADDTVEEASEESFPASDPPSFSPGAT